MNWNPVATIARKRDGKALSPQEIIAFMDGFTRGTVPDYQMSALAMAIYLNGMEAEETAALTSCMLQSGITLSWPTEAPAIVDKHSTGGIGDKVSLILAPLLACCGVWVPMISGRGLGPTGGTLDKLESIPGYRTDLSIDEIRQVTSQVGCVITGASADIAPADKKLYALRDVTATVASIPLITASIMSKKLAEGLKALVLDVKWGSGAFMKSVSQARELATSMVTAGHRMGVATTALITDMNQPLGRMAGNAVEIRETLDTLAGNGPKDLVELTVVLGAELLVLTGGHESTATAREEILRNLNSGAGFEKFSEMVVSQGGSLRELPAVGPASEFLARKSGWLVRIETEQLGWAIIEMGGGRRVLSDPLDHSVGLEFMTRIGEQVKSGQPLVRIFAPSEKAVRAHPYLAAAFDIQDEPMSAPKLIVERIG